jgi:hypothetical protein
MFSVDGCGMHSMADDDYKFGPQRCYRSFGWNLALANLGEPAVPPPFS